MKRIRFVMLALIVCFFSCTKKRSIHENYPVAEITTELKQAMVRYDAVTGFHNGLAVVREGKKEGLMDIHGNIVIPCEYGTLKYQDGYYLSTIYSRSYSDNRHGVIDSLGNVILDCKYLRLNPFFKDGYIRVAVAGSYYPRIDSDIQYGIFDLQGNAVLPVGSYLTKGYSALSGFRKEYQENENPLVFSDGIAIVQRAGESHPSYVNKSGKKLFEPHLRPLDDMKTSVFRDGISFSLYAPDNTYRYINTKGETTMCLTSTDEGLGVIDNNSNVIVPNEYKSIDIFENGVFLVSKDNNYRPNYRLFSIEQKKEVLTDYYVIPYMDPITGISHIFDHGLIRVKKKDGRDEIGLVNLEGKVIVPLDFKDDFFGEPIIISDNCIRVAKMFSEGDKDIWQCGIYSIDGEILVPCIYEGLEMYDSGFVVAKFPANYYSMGTSGEHIRYGLYDREGNIVAGCTYGLCHPFNEGLAAVMDVETEKWGFIDLDGDLVIPFKYEFADCFAEGLAPVKYNGRWGFVNRIGKDTFDD